MIIKDFLKKLNNKNNDNLDNCVDCAEMPYFLENKEWYYHDGMIYRLTNKAPQEAIDSYNEWYNDGDDC